MWKRLSLLLVIIAGCSKSVPNAATSWDIELNKSIVARYGKGSRLMCGDDATSQAIINRYCLAESKDADDDEHDPNDPYQSGWRPWLCGPLPQTYDMTQNRDGTYHIRYRPENLGVDGKPIDVWTHKGVKNVELDEFIDGLRKARGSDEPSK